MGRAVASTDASTDTIEAFGQRMTVAMAMQFGFINRDQGGNFTATDEGRSGGPRAEATQGVIQLPSGGTAEEASGSDFKGTEGTQEALNALTQSVQADTQRAALDSLIHNAGTLDRRVLEQMASQASVEPEHMAEIVDTARQGMEAAVMKHLAPLGVYDPDVFTSYLHGSQETRQRMVDSVRDLMLNNSTRGFESLAEDFAANADKVDPQSVEWALEDAGIPFIRQGSGGVVLDLTAQGMGQMAFRQAVQLGIIKLGRHT